MLRIYRGLYDCMVDSMMGMVEEYSRPIHGLVGSQGPYASPLSAPFVEQMCLS